MEDGIVNEAKTTINSSTIIDGNIKATEHLIINGRIRGKVDIEGYNLFIGPGGRIVGEIRAQNVRVRGHMKGDIIASGKVEIAKEANFSGNIKSKGISVEKGAYFDAHVDLGQKASGTAAPEKSSTEKSTAALV
jgi:cytoskeletal protein CcmA (bactofilin family)